MSKLELKLTHERSGITNDPNRSDESEYIVRLLGQLITVSRETVTIVNELNLLPISAPEGTK